MDQFFLKKNDSENDFAVFENDFVKVLLINDYKSC